MPEPLPSRPIRRPALLCPFLAPLLSALCRAGLQGFL